MKVVEEGIETIEKKELENSETIYLGFTGEKKQDASLFGRIVSKYSICDICHDIHFYFLLNREGRLVYFSPIHLTKYGNLNWTYQEIMDIKSRIKGKDLFKPLPFNPQVDAVSQATMTSFLIFEGLNDTKAVLNDFSEAGFRKDYFKKLCLQQLREMKDIILLFKKRYPEDIFTKEDQVTIDLEKIQKMLPDQAVPRCPTKGDYLFMEDSPMCSIHGMNMD